MKSSSSASEGQRRSTCRPFGTVNASEVAVTVNGRPAAVANRSFSVEGLALVPGPNAITATAVDQSGNEGRTTVTVRYDPTRCGRSPSRSA